jgi:competence protein ComEC
MLMTSRSVVALAVAGMLTASCAAPEMAESSPPEREVEPDVVEPDEDATDNGEADEVETHDGGSADAPVAEGTLEVHFIDVGQANATLLHHAEVTMLIDQGDWQRDDVVVYLRSVGIDQLDVVATTHPHADHIGQFDQVLDSFEVDEVWWSGSTTTTQTFERALDALEASDAAYSEPRAGQSVELGPLLVEIVGPGDDANFEDLHDANLSMRITYGQVRMLFTGDAEAATEQRMVDRHAPLLDAEIYEVGHHGSSTSTTPQFLDAVDPQVSIYSARAGNSYGHPHAEVIDRLEAHDTELYGTDVHGTVIVTTDGDTFDLATERDGTPAPGDATPQDDDNDDDAVAAGDGACSGGQVDINSAAANELQQIDHIGPDRAAEIVRSRPLPSVESLTRIDGIGPARIGDILAQGVACAS